MRKIISSQTVIIYKGKKPTPEALSIMGEEILVGILKGASPIFTHSSQVANDHYLFIQSSGLDYMLASFCMGYDPQIIRNEFKRYFINENIISAQSI